MRKDVIFVEPWKSRNYMDFKYKGADGILYLFTVKFNQTVYIYFESGKSIAQLRRDKNWKKCYVLERLVETRIPYAMRQLKLRGEKCYE